MPDSISVLNSTCLDSLPHLATIKLPGELIHSPGFFLAKNQAFPLEILYLALCYYLWIKFYLSEFMFDSPDFPLSLEESRFESWLEKGRESKISYAYLLVIWDEFEGEYLPVFVQTRSEIQSYPRYGTSPERQMLVAAYDLYSESRVM
ncbi:hypothetical protein SAMN04488104_102540 [Algoriphagus faecimaris]|uniref:Uncharacterized protein n=1 Tax=Algoriphagus faecimaris TaxID=686796 RepID=A0A1G6U010_9BACT|nr:hypothetical protein SAMN04488104_102540 [Algoriphagus faecimaris]